jgi:GH35 family endo-1,4-beta-xylanase
MWFWCYCQASGGCQKNPSKLSNHNLCKADALALGMVCMQSFRWAMQYGGPGVKLYHSEHNIWNYTKIQPVASFLTELRSKGVRIDGVFFQVCLEAFRSV